MKQWRKIRNLFTCDRIKLFNAFVNWDISRWISQENMYPFAACLLLKLRLHFYHHFNALFVHIYFRCNDIYILILNRLYKSHEKIWKLLQKYIVTTFNIYVCTIIFLRNEIVLISLTRNNKRRAEIQYTQFSQKRSFIKLISYCIINFAISRPLLIL